MRDWRVNLVDHENPETCAYSRFLRRGCSRGAFQSLTVIQFIFSFASLPDISRPSRVESRHNWSEHDERFWDGLQSVADCTADAVRSSTRPTTSATKSSPSWSPRLPHLRARSPHACRSPFVDPELDRIRKQDTCHALSVSNAFLGPVFNPYFSPKQGSFCMNADIECLNSIERNILFWKSTVHNIWECTKYTSKQKSTWICAQAINMLAMKLAADPFVKVLRNKGRSP